MRLGSAIRPVISFFAQGLCLEMVSCKLWRGWQAVVGVLSQACSAFCLFFSPLFLRLVAHVLPH
jgi:hypothetical protein